MHYEWTEAMATGVEETDNEHRTLIAWINELTEANARGTGEHEVMRILTFLGFYASKHFAHEEGCFARHRCPHAAGNRRAHEQFTATVNQMKLDCEAHGVTAMKAVELQRALGDWLQSHLLRVDTALKPCVK